MSPALAGQVATKARYKA